ENYKDGTVNIKLIGDAIVQAQRVRQRLILVALFESPSEQIRQFERMNQEAEKLDEIITQFKGNEESEENPEVGNFPLLDAFETSWSEAMQTADEVARTAMAGQQEEAKLKLIGSAENRINHAIDLLLLIQDVEDNHSLDRFAISQRIDQRVGGVLTAMMVAANIIAVVLGFWLSRAIATRIDAVATEANHIARGNLSGHVQVRSNDEIGDLAAAFNKMTERLREVLGSLEQRVAVRTRDLALAAEVGSRISTVRDMDALLAESVELIRSEFDLYYVQIYLAGANGRHLKLTAGTGEAGEALLRRGHQLAVGPGSINGSAAARQEAVVVPDTATSPIFRPNPLLPKTRSEMAVPMVVGDRLEGVLNLQDNEPNSLTGDNLGAFEAVATQLAIALENARLFVEATQAQETMANQARVLARGGWTTFLDAVQRREWFGYAYDADKVEPLAEIMSAEAGSDGLTAPIAVSGEPVGTIQLEPEEARPLTPEDNELTEAVARQVAERIESLRLLVEADRYRNEAEAAARRLVREGWETFHETTAEMTPGYVFDHTQVQPVSEDASEVSFKQELLIQGEKIGELGLA
ncbi:MAG: GAF domain-containing protein, partial [Anaerolineae bacterium]